jgi:hypothetical protein
MDILSVHQKLTPTHPVTTWHRGRYYFALVPVLVCTPPEKTVGLGDSISAAGLELHKFIPKRDRAHAPSTQGMDGMRAAHVEDDGPPTAARLQNRHKGEL